MNHSVNRTAWGAKAQRTVSISNEAWELLTQAATEAGVNRSEVLEIVCRYVADQQLDLHAIRREVLSQDRSGG